MRVAAAYLHRGEKVAMHGTGDDGEVEVRSSPSAAVEVDHSGGVVNDEGAGSRSRRTDPR